MTYDLLKSHEEKMVNDIGSLFKEPTFDIKIVNIVRFQDKFKKTT